MFYKSLAGIAAAALVAIAGGIGWQTWQNREVEVVKPFYDMSGNTPGYRGQPD